MRFVTTSCLALGMGLATGCVTAPEAPPPAAPVHVQPPAAPAVEAEPVAVEPVAAEPPAAWEPVEPRPSESEEPELLAADPVAEELPSEPVAAPADEPQAEVEQPSQWTGELMCVPFSCQADPMARVWCEVECELPVQDAGDEAPAESESPAQPVVVDQSEDGQPLAGVDGALPVSDDASAAPPAPATEVAVGTEVPEVEPAAEELEVEVEAEVEVGPLDGAAQRALYEAMREDIRAGDLAAAHRRFLAAQDRMPRPDDAEGAAAHDDVQLLARYVDGMLHQSRNASR